MNELSRQNQELAHQRQETRTLPMTANDADLLKQQRKLLKKFVAEQLTMGIDNDYAVIPGTKKSSLLKPGAEKLLRLFGLGSRVTQTNQIIQKDGNFAMFNYKAEIVHLQTGNIISECEASCNSQEKKYKERTVWKKNKNGTDERVTEETPIFDILNTLMKMCQKRAIVGATILAVGGSDFFSQDIEDERDAQAIGATTGAVKNENSGQSGEFIVPFGKSKGKKVSELSKAQVNDYQNWFSKLDAEPKGQAAELKKNLEAFLK